MLLRKLFYSSILLMLLFASGCDSLKGPELSLTANPDNVAAGGIDYSEISAFLKLEGSPAVNKVVAFETTNGSFSATSDQSDTEITTDGQGYAIAKLYSAQNQGEATVTARYYDEDSGEEVTKSVTVVFGPPSAKSLPMAGNFNLDCDYTNVGALVSESKPDINVACQITAKSVKGDVIPPESLTFHYFAEAGVLSGGYDEGHSGFIATYSVRGGDALPMDVEPLSGEPSRSCAGKTCNPRDGLVTLMVVTTGAERFQDNNGNGEWDSNEPFDDLPEPFLDKNDNGQWDPGEPYFDTDGNGEYSEANGIFDAETKISASFKILWTGALEENETAATFEYQPSTTDNMPNGSSILITVRLVDKNLNILASFPENGDAIVFSDNQGGMNATTNNNGNVTVPNQTGIALDDEGRFLSFDESISYLDVTFVDANPIPDPESPPMPFFIVVGGNLSPGPEGEGSFISQVEHIFSEYVDGTVN